MIKPTRGQILALAILAVLAFFRLPAPDYSQITDTKSEFFSSFPMTLGAWAGRETAPDERTLAILETRNVLSREYQNPEGKKLHLLLVSSRRDRRVAHPPEVCYTGAHYNIFDGADDTIEAGGRRYPVREFRAVNERNPEDKEQVLYLYKVGESFTTNYYAQQFRFALDRVTRRESEVLLIRVSGPDKAAAEEFLKLVLDGIERNP